MVLATPLPGLVSTPPSPPSSGDVIVIFYASIDPSTGTMWCPDCRRVKSTISWLFDGPDKPLAYVVYVGSKEEWKLPAMNQYRKDYKISSIPTMVKLRDGKEISRLTEDEILDTDALGRFFLC